MQMPQIMVGALYCDKTLLGYGLGGCRNLQYIYIVR